MSQRFYDPPESRLVVSKWDPSSPQTMEIITLLDRLATRRHAHFQLGDYSWFRGRVPSADPEINILHTDNFAFDAQLDLYNLTGDYPFLAEGVRLLHWFRNENSGLGGTVWMCRFAGFVQTTSDEGDPNVNYTTFEARDGWAYLDSRPCLRCVLDGTNTTTCNLVAGLPEIDPVPKGIVVFPGGTEIQYIVGELLRRTISANGPAMIDAGDGSSATGDGNDYGGTSFWGGTIENAAALTNNWVIQDGTSVGEAWRQLVETGLIQILLTPIYDPDNRPGYTHELSIYRSDSGQDGIVANQPNSPLFSWDRSGHDMTSLVRTTDGSDRANKLQFFGPNGYRAGVQTSTPSITRFGQYWTQSQFVRLTRNDQINVSAEKELSRRLPGRRMWEFSPTPEWTFRPFQDYDLGWYTELYHSQRLREEAYLAGRITGFDIDISDEGVESVSAIAISPDDLENPAQP